MILMVMLLDFIDHVAMNGQYLCAINCSAVLKNALHGSLDIVVLPVALVINFWHALR